MHLQKQFTLLHVLCLTVAWGSPAIAGPLFPCVRAVSSNNGNFIVISDVKFGPEQINAVKLRRVSLEVFPKENFINAKDKLIAPATYWTEWVLWSVALDSSGVHNEPECPLPLITDDGEFLILLQTGPTFGDDSTVLRIYRRRDHLGDPLREGPDHGVFIKDIVLKEIWTPDRLAANPRFWTDSTPQWFAGGTFEFSSDYRQLIHKTRWGNTVRINLADGAVLEE